MLERTERSIRITSVLSNVEPDFHTGSGPDQKVPAPKPWTLQKCNVDGQIRIVSSDRGKIMQKQCCGSGRLLFGPDLEVGLQILNSKIDLFFKVIFFLLKFCLPIFFAKIQIF